LPSHSLRLYVEVARTTARRMSTYRGATLAGIFTNTVFGFLPASILRAVFQEQGTIGGFDTVDAVTFTFLAQGLAMPVGMFGYTEMAERILTGEVAMDLCRPYDYQGWWAAAAYGRASFYSWARGIPPFLAGGLAFDLRVPDTWSVWIAFAVSALMAVGLGFAWGFLVQLTAFWITDVRGPNQIAWIVAGFLSGMFGTIVVFPGWLEALARALPFASMIQVPGEVFLGKHEGLDLLRVLLVQVAWLGALVLAGRVVLARAVRKLVVLGG
jgi:ABC-2 type transport system permease protein